MALFNSGNPSFGKNTYNKMERATDVSDVMTVNGSIGKTAILLALVILGSIASWTLFPTLIFKDLYTPYIIGTAIAGFIVCVIIVCKKHTAPYLSPVYAIIEGLFLGAFSAFANEMYSGIVLQAFSLTFLVATLMLALYYFRIIKATEKFKSVVIMATISIGLFYLGSIILRFFGIYSPLYGFSMLSIGISVFVVIIAALNLILDFNFIEEGAEYGAPKFMEWYGAFGLMVTLVWLYLEILRLLMKLAERR